MRHTSEDVSKAKKVKQSLMETHSEKGKLEKRKSGKG